MIELSIDEKIKRSKDLVIIFYLLFLKNSLNEKKNY